MIELIKARLEVLSVEMETVSLLGHTSASDSPHHIAAMERENELKHEISLLQRSLGKAHSEAASDAQL